MSLNRENIIWQSADGTYRRGFYDFTYVGDPSDEDFDHEWDVEYFNYFNWVSKKFSTFNQAHDAWTGPNPGTYSTITHKEDPEAVAELDQMAEDFLKSNR